MKKFSRKTTSQLKSYVYLLVDPQSDEIFYVGKGSGSSRPFEHLDLRGTKEGSRKEQKIRELRAAGIEPQIEILRHGLSANTAKEVEASVIDAIGLHKLTNKNSGDKSYERGRLTAARIEAKLGGEPLDVSVIQDPCILFYRKEPVPESQLYDATRQFWKLARDRVEKLNDDGDLYYQFAFAMQGNLVLEVYQILAWFPAGTTVSSRQFEPDKYLRWEFVGAIATPRIRNRYRNKILMRNGMPLHAAQIGFRYLG